MTRTLSVYTELAKLDDSYVIYAGWLSGPGWMTRTLSVYTGWLSGPSWMTTLSVYAGWLSGPRWMTHVCTLSVDLLFFAFCAAYPVCCIHGTVTVLLSKLDQGCNPSC